MAKIELAHLKELAEMSGPIFTTRIPFTKMIFAMLLAQQLAADQRAPYQSKLIGEHLFYPERLFRLFSLPFFN